MNRSLLMLAGALLLGSVVFAASYVTARRMAVVCCSRPADDQGWLRAEFHLNEPALARIRQLDQSYQPTCAAMCAQLAAKASELQASLQNPVNATTTTARLIELGELRAQCQARMLQHFIQVSQLMPVAAGRRYLAEMESLTLAPQAPIPPARPPRSQP